MEARLPGLDRTFPPDASAVSAVFQPSKEPQKSAESRVAPLPRLKKLPPVQPDIVRP
jgi:hypothetical protein